MLNVVALGFKPLIGRFHEHPMKQCRVAELHVEFADNPCMYAGTHACIHTRAHYRQTTSCRNEFQAGITKCNFPVPQIY
jgi:hypothetical protein